jgi:hypothetical protein
MTPTDQTWRPSFCDYHGVTKATYKVLKLVDATWSLDSIDPVSGRVVNFEAPLFNRL